MTHLETLNALAEVIEQADKKLQWIEDTKWMYVTFSMKQKTRHRIDIMNRTKQRLRERWMKVVNQMWAEVNQQKLSLIPEIPHGKLVSDDCFKNMTPIPTETELHKMWYENYPVKDI